MGIISFENPEAGEARSGSDTKIRAALVKLKELVNGEINNENLSASAGIKRAQLAEDAKRFTWYEPKVIATEESRTNTAFGTLTTADEIKSVVLPENGLIAIGYLAKFKSSVSEAGRAAIFLGSNQLKKMEASAVPAVQEAKTVSTTFRGIVSGLAGLASGNLEPGADVTTGQILSSEGGTLTYVFAAAGTYNISIQFKASSGSVTAKERKLWVATLG